MSLSEAGGQRGRARTKNDRDSGCGNSRFYTWGEVFMSLLVCPDCGHNVSDRAETCPGCGCPVSKIKTAEQPAPEQKPHSETEGAVPPGAANQLEEGVPFWVKAMVVSVIIFILYILGVPRILVYEIFGTPNIWEEKSEEGQKKGVYESFAIKNVTMKRSFNITDVMGDLTNNSGRNYEQSIFRMSFYDGAEKLVGICDIFILNFQNGETVTFRGSTADDLSSAETYRLRLNMGM